jgi:hypothetical protein
MYMSYMLYQAEHVKSAKEQREEDVQAGRLAAEFGRRRRSPGRRRAGRPPRVQVPRQACPYHE